MTERAGPKSTGAVTREQRWIQCDALARRFQPGYQALRGGSGHHPGPAGGRRLDQSFGRHAGHDAGSPADDDGERNAAPRRIYGRRPTEDGWRD